MATPTTNNDQIAPLQQSDACRAPVGGSKAAFFGLAHKQEDEGIIQKYSEANRFALYVISMLATEPRWAYISYGQSADPQVETPDRLYVELQSFYADYGSKAPDVDNIAAWLERALKPAKGDGLDALPEKIEQVYDGLYNGVLPQKCFSNDAVNPVASSTNSPG